MRSFNVWLSAQMTRETQVLVDGSHDALDAQSASVLHLLGQSVVPWHLYVGHVGDSVPAARGVHVPGVTLHTPQAPQAVEQQTLSTQFRVAQSSLVAHAAAIGAPESTARARRR